MTDLVARLAARAVGAGPPRAVPRPVPRFADADRGGREDEDTGSVDVPVGAPVADHEPTDVPDRHDEHAVAGATPRHPVSTGSPPLPEASTPRRPDRVVTSRDDSIDPGRPPTTAGEPRPDRDPAPVVARPPSAGVEHGPDVETRAGPPVELAPLPDIVPVGGIPTESGASVASDGRPTPVVARSVPAEAPSSGSDVATEATTIKVHIGRLEVRAAPAPSSSRPRSDPPGPDTSLAEYLRGHRGGR